jgi:hypothetical protein
MNNECRQHNPFVNWITIYDSMFLFSTITYNVDLIKKEIAICAEI